ncbi:Mu homology domain-containing protein [Blyttiomyces helicus]|uniref:Coatomer subunit delta n=1 Tax=Blyttiomyces helicus TaxID=388810 RepID=A0A4P9WAV4_9FUNG|nr:Mu homology domain-containing protein [Blyttiomyces helicus]|eukprot:RKO87376.1 Mu homology domain-containing protein [Blyttiomyces helicus]
MLPRPAAAPSRGKGMQLGRKQADSVMIETIKADEGIVEASTPLSAGATSTTPAAQTESVHLTIEEKISVTANRDGGLQSMEVNGSMTLRTVDPNRAHLKVAMKVIEDPNVQFKTHPNVDRQLFSERGVLALKNATRPFPVNQSLGILKWRFMSKDENAIPLAINCWPSPSGTGSCDVNIEYELQNSRLELRDVIVSVPFPGSTPPTIGDVEGHYQIDRQHRTIEWQMPIIDQSNRSGVLEFSVQSEDVGGFFPIKVSFTSARPYCDLEVLDVTNLEGAPVPFSKEGALSTEEYCVA